MAKKKTSTKINKSKPDDLEKAVNKLILKEGITVTDIRYHHLITSTDPIQIVFTAVVTTLSEEK